jgi:hypothetical protein
MRTFRGDAPIIIGAGWLAVLLLLPAPSPLRAEPLPPILHAGTLPISVPVDRTPADPKASFETLKARLDASDRETALKTLLVALRELGDGDTLTWRRPSRLLEGEITPISAFRDDKGRVCRHLSYKLTLGQYSRVATGNACREKDGSWSLSG